MFSPICDSLVISHPGLTRGQIIRKVANIPHLNKSLKMMEVRDQSACGMPK